MEGIEKKLHDLRKEIASDVRGLFPHGASPSDEAIGYLISDIERLIDARIKEALSSFNPTSSAGGT